MGLSEMPGDYRELGAGEDPGRYGDVSCPNKITGNSHLCHHHITVIDGRSGHNTRG